MLDFIQSLERKIRIRPMAIFWDNCSIHTAHDVQDYLMDRKIPHVTNVPYSPWYNGIELVWAKAKHDFRA